MVGGATLTMMTPMPMPTPPMMCSLPLNTSSMAVGQLWETQRPGDPVSGPALSPSTVPYAPV